MSGKSSFTFIVEHMEEGMSEWCQLEYRHMIKQLGQGNLILSGLTEKTLQWCTESKRLEGAVQTSKTVLEIADVSKVLLLDSESPTELSPEDSKEGHEYLLFGGILGDDPPKDRTSELRKLGFATRHLGRHQMTTDTAVIVSKRVLVDGVRLSEMHFVDRPDIKLNAHESVNMPFRYIVEDGKPLTPDGFVDLLKKTNDDPLMFD